MLLANMLLVSLAASFTTPTSRPPPRCARRSSAPRCCSGATDIEAIVQACLEGPTSALPSEAKDRVEAYVRELLRYNERTNVYSKSAYEHLPFHVQDSVVLAEHLASQQPSDGGGGVLDLGSGSGLPSVVLACVMPDRPVFAIESKSRKTRFLTQVADPNPKPQPSPAYYCSTTTAVYASVLLYLRTMPSSRRSRAS